MDTVDALFQKGCLPAGQVIFFPIRHHSPACSRHLEKLLEEVKPDAVLIEGPADTSHLIPHMGDPDNRAPLCIYYSYKEGAGEAERRSSCYYPMLDFSPELTAIRYGARSGVYTAFIDLPYSELSRIEAQKKPEEGKQSYYDDYYLSRSQFIEALCKKKNCRHYAELWEKLFEIGGASASTPSFIRNVLGLCWYSRVEYPREMLETEGCLEREAYMAWNIAQARERYAKIVVVTGGFHTSALIQSLQEDCPQPKLHTGGASCYLIPYSFSESDQLAGYASGMPYPAFYQKVHEKLADAPKTAFDDTVLELLAGIGGALRKQKESTSIADEIAASVHSRGLAALRDKGQQGVYELLDAVRSTYIKGELDRTASAMMQTATLILRGDRMGRVSSGAEQVPLLLDFRENATKLRLKIATAARQEVTLDILTKAAHREASAFFHRLSFLDVGFGEMAFGPTYRNRDVSRVREKWRYAAGARVESAIIDVSYLGGTVGEAATTLLRRKKREFAGCGEFSRLLIDAAVMDLTGEIATLVAETQGAIARDGSFRSLAAAASDLLFLENAKWLLSLEEVAFAGELLEQVYAKAAALLPELSSVPEDEDRELAGVLKELHQIAARPGIDSALLTDALRSVAENANPPPCLQGAAVGLLHSGGHITLEQVLDHTRAYLFGAGEMVKRSGRFLGGVFLTAWDLIFQSVAFVEGLSHVLEQLPQEEFLNLLPDFRLAFSTFTPGQVDRIASMAAGYLGIGEDVLTEPPVPEELLRLGRDLDRWAAEKMGEGEAS